MQKWEYCSEKLQVRKGGAWHEISGELSGFGSEGWELVGFQYLEASEPAENPHVICLFKRPKP